MNKSKTLPKISPITIGTWVIGGKNKGGYGYGDIVDKHEAINAIRMMIDNGVNIIDTAPGYGDGKSEVIVGEAIKGYENRVLIATKFGSSANIKDGSRIIDNSYERIISECDESLKRLNIKTIDFYLMHWPDENTPIKETMEALNYLKKNNKIRYIGLSNPSKSLIKEARLYGDIDIIQMPFSMLNRKNQELFSWANKQGILTMCYGSLGAGILSGAIRELPNFDERDTRNVFYPYFKEPNFGNIQKFLKKLDVLVDKYNKPMAQIALNWCIQKDFISTALVGIKNTDEARENSETLQWKLTSDDILYIDSELDKLGEFE